METSKRCFWQYPLPRDQIEFRLAVPQGAEIVDIIEVETLFTKDHVLVMLVDANQEEGEDVRLRLYAPGEVIEPGWTYVGKVSQLVGFAFLCVHPDRVPHGK